MNNADFKAMLRMPREALKSEEKETSSEKQPKAKREYDASRKERKKQKTAEWKARQEDLKKLKDQYRDRAEERRKEANPDYVGIDAPGAEAGSGVEKVNNVKISIENSKFLGGDLKYTHLVKGLDYALLTKIKGELTDKELMEKQEQEQLKAKEKQEARKSLVPVIRSSLARRIHSIILDTDRPSTDKFMPGRMAFVFECDEDEQVYQDIPTTLLRSKEDCPEVKEVISGAVPADVMKAMDTLCGYIRQGVSQKKRKRKDKKKKLLANQITTPNKMVLSSDVDIFDDAGTYNTKQSGSSDKHKPLLQKDETYFNKGEEGKEDKHDKTERERGLDMVNQTVALAQAQQNLEEANKKYSESSVKDHSKSRSQPPRSSNTKLQSLREEDKIEFGVYEMDIMNGMDDSDDDEDGTAPHVGRTSVKQMMAMSEQKLKKDLNQINVLMDKRKRESGGYQDPSKRRHFEY